MRLSRCASFPSPHRRAASAPSLRPRQERAVEFERGFSVVAPTSVTRRARRRQEAVLLGAIETMDLVDEQQRARPSHVSAQPLEGRAQILDPEKMAESCSNSSPAWRASNRAMVVLPVPAGPEDEAGKPALRRMRRSAIGPSR